MAAAITEQHPAVESYVRCVQLVRAAILEPRVRKEFDSLQLPPVARPLSLWGTSLFIGWHMRSACYGPILRVARCKGVTHAAGCTLGGYAGCILKEFRMPQFVMMGKGAFAFGQGSWHLTRKGRESQQRWARWEGERNDRRPLSSLSSCSRKPPIPFLGQLMDPSGTYKVVSVDHWSYTRPMGTASHQLDNRYHGPEVLCCMVLHLSFRTPRIGYASIAVGGFVRHRHRERRLVDYRACTCT